MKSIRTPFNLVNGSVASTDKVDLIVKQQVVDYFMTVSRERVRNAGYGGNLPKFAFESLDTLEMNEYQIDAIAEANNHILFGEVTNVSILQNDNSSIQNPVNENQTEVSIQYVVAPRTISTVKLVINTALTEESEF